MDQALGGAGALISNPGLDQKVRRLGFAKIDREAGHDRLTAFPSQKDMGELARIQ
jgi:hypothetical protein